jgi:hypothetical protein
MRMPMSAVDELVEKYRAGQPISMPMSSFAYNADWADAFAREPGLYGKTRGLDESQDLQPVIFELAPDAQLGEIGRGELEQLAMGQFDILNAFPTIARAPGRLNTFKIQQTSMVPDGYKTGGLVGFAPGGEVDSDLLGGGGSFDRLVGGGGGFDGSTDEEMAVKELQKQQLRAAFAGQPIPVTPGSMTSISGKEAAKQQDARDFSQSTTSKIFKGLSNVTSGTWWADTLGLGSVTESDAMTQKRYIPFLSEATQIISDVYSHYRYNTDLNTDSWFLQDDGNSISAGEELKNTSWNDVLNLFQTMAPADSFSLGQDVGDMDLTGAQRGASGALAAAGIVLPGKLGKKLPDNFADLADKPHNLSDILARTEGYERGSLADVDISGLDELKTGTRSDKRARDQLASMAEMMLGVVPNARQPLRAIDLADQLEFSNEAVMGLNRRAEGLILLSRDYVKDTPYFEESLAAGADPYHVPGFGTHTFGISPDPYRVSAIQQVVAHEIAHQFFGGDNSNWATQEFALRNAFIDLHPELGLKRLENFGDIKYYGGGQFKDPIIEQVFRQFLADFLPTYSFGGGGKKPREALVASQDVNVPLSDFLAREEAPANAIEDLVVNGFNLSAANMGLLADYKAGIARAAGEVDAPPGSGINFLPDMPLSAIYGPTGSPLVPDWFRSPRPGATRVKGYPRESIDLGRSSGLGDGVMAAAALVSKKIRAGLYEVNSGGRRFHVEKIRTDDPGGYGVENNWWTTPIDSGPDPGLDPAPSLTDALNQITKLPATGEELTGWADWAPVVGGYPDYISSSPRRSGGDRIDVAGSSPPRISVTEPDPFLAALNAPVPNLMGGGRDINAVREILGIEYGKGTAQQLSPEQYMALQEIVGAAPPMGAEEAGRLAVKTWPYNKEFNPYDEEMLDAIEQYTSGGAPFYDLASMPASPAPGRMDRGFTVPDHSLGVSNPYSIGSQAAEMAKRIENLDAAIAMSPRVPAGGMWITRAMGNSWRAEMKGRQYGATGFRQEGRGFQSSSPGIGDVTPWPRETMARIYLPEGFPAIYLATPGGELELPTGLRGVDYGQELSIDQLTRMHSDRNADTLSVYPNQNELLLPRNTGLSVLKEFDPVPMADYFRRLEQLLGVKPGSIDGSGSIQGWGDIKNIREVEMIADAPDSPLMNYYRQLLEARARGGVGTFGMGTQAPPFATGGPVFGAGTGTSDSIPAWLSNGEFVHNAAAVSYYGTDFMHAINGQQLPEDIFGGGGRFSAGGEIARFAPGGLAGDPTYPTPAGSRPPVGGGEPLPYDLAQYRGQYDSGPTSEYQAAPQDNPFVYLPLGPKVPFEQALKEIQKYIQWQEQSYETFIKGPLDLQKRQNQALEAYNTAIQDAATAELELTNLRNMRAKEMAELKPGQDPFFIEAKYAEKIAAAEAKFDVQTNKRTQEGQNYENSVAAIDQNRAAQRDVLIEGPPSREASKSKTKGDKNAESLGLGLVEGILQGLGFGDVFGDFITEWGIFKAGVGVLGFGMEVAQNAGLIPKPGTGAEAANSGLGPGTAQGVASGAFQSVAPGLSIPGAGGIVGAGFNAIPGVGAAPGSNVPNVSPASSVTPAMTPAAPDPLTQTGGSGPAPGPRGPVVENKNYYYGMLGAADIPPAIASSAASALATAPG